MHQTTHSKCYLKEITTLEILEQILILWVTRNGEKWELVNLAINLKF